MDVANALDELIARSPLAVAFQPILDVTRGGPAALLDLAYRHDRLIELDRRRALAIAPLMDARGPIGVLATTSSAGTFSAAHARWLGALAAVAAPHLENPRLSRIAITDELTLALNRRALDQLIPRDATPPATRATRCSLAPIARCTRRRRAAATAPR